MSDPQKKEEVELGGCMVLSGIAELHGRHRNLGRTGCLAYPSGHRLHIHPAVLNKQVVPSFH